MSETWAGWVRMFGRWLRLTGPHPDLATARRALDDEIKRRRISVARHWLRLTTGEPPRD